MQPTRRAARSCSRRRALASLLAGAALAVASCGGDREGPAPAASSTAPAPIPERPSDLAAHVVIAAPRVALPLLRERLGDVAAGLPRSFGVLVTGSTDLPITAAEHVSDDAPIAVSVLATEADVDAVVAVHLRAADRLQTVATAGEDAPFRAVPGAAGLTKLVPVRSPRFGSLHLAVAGNHLLLATSDGALDRAGAFTERAPRPALRPGEIAAIEHGAAAPLLARRLAARALAPLPAAFRSLLGVDASGELPVRLGTALDALEGGRTSLRIEDGIAQLSVTVGDSPLTRLAVASLAASPPASWLELPKDASVALLFHGAGAADPLTPSDEAATSLGLAGPRREAVAAALTSLDRARGPSLAIAAGTSPGGPALWFRAPLADTGGADAALHALVKAFGEKPRKERPSVTARETVVERVGDVVRLRLRVAGPDERPPVDVIVRREADLLLGATGLDAISALQALRDGPEGARLRGDAFARRLAATARAHHGLGLLDVEGLAALLGGKRRPERRVLVGASLAEEGGVMRLLLLAEPSALPLLHEKLAAP